MTKTLIVGAGVAGKELSQELRQHTNLGYEVVGFVDDDPEIQNTDLEGIKVVGKINSLTHLLKSLDIKLVFIAIPSAKGSLVREIVDSCLQSKVLFRIVPRVLEMIQGKVQFEKVRSISIEDLLGRAILKAEQPLLQEVFQNRVVLITGAAGSIGSELCRQLSEFNPKKLILLDNWESGLFEIDRELEKTFRGEKESIITSIQDKNKIQNIFEELKPEIVFHAAAFKHVPLMEANPEEAIKNNILGTKILVEAAGKNNVEKFIFISSDKAVNPSSVMGASKAFAELILRYYSSTFSTKFISVRFGNVLGSQGSVVPIFEKQIASGGPVTVTDPKMVRFFMSIPEAVQLVLQSARLGKGGEIFVLDMGEPVKILDLAKMMIRLAGFEEGKEIKIVISGKRPGEKMYEEVLTEEENLGKTDNKLIFATKNVLDVTDDDLMESFNKLLVLSEEQDRGGIITELRKTISTYKPL